jgi:protein tyrosine phosphatase (PTP) superfamily phosphohydrolase (DUF442 family)
MTSELSAIYNFLPLSDTLLTSGQPTREQFTAAARAGVRIVINLALETSTGAIPDEESLVAGLGMGYIHIPVVWERPVRADLEAFAAAMNAHAAEKILVHCAANMRVSAFVALYRIVYQGWSRDQALADLHRIWDPDQEPVWRAFMDSALASGDPKPTGARR